MEKFCYWQEKSPAESYFNYSEKICLLRFNEYKIQEELQLTKYGKKINIICPYKNKEDALSCLDYSLIKDIK